MTHAAGTGAGVAALVRRMGRLMALLPLFMLGTALLPAHAESLAGVSQSSVPAPPAEVRALHTVGPHLVAFSDAGAWYWISAEKQWRAVALPPDADAAGWQNAAIGRLYQVRPSSGESAVRVVAEATFADGRLALRDLPQFPLPLARLRLAEGAGVLHVVGQDELGVNHVFRRRLDAAAGTAWQSIPAWGGDGAADTLVAQRGELVVTIAAESGDALWRWSVDHGWQALPPVPGRVLTADGARAVGQAHVLYLLKADAAGARAPRLATFHTVTRAWADLPAPTGTMPAPVTAWGDGFAGADASLGAIRMVEVSARSHLLTWLDWLVIVVYLAAMVGIGMYFYLQEKRASTADFFVGGRSIPFWAAGVSLYATNTSSISFIAIPAKAFETNWQYLTNNLIAVLGLMFVAVWIVPLLRRLDLMSVFSYLEKRFHPAIRMLASALCIAMQIGSRMSVILFLPALAIATITGVDVVWSILIMGVFTILYTTLGGMKAVIWTDFVQVFVMFGGAIFAIGFIIYHLNGGVPELVQVAMAEDKTRLFDFSFDLTKATVWGFIFLVLFDVVLTFPKDQVLMQRVLSTKSDKEAGRSIWTFAAIMVPGGFFFYAIGTALYVYYQSHPERMNPLLPLDATFPLFIAAELPMGVTGLIIAGIFAAAMSTLSSIINSVSTLASVDFYEKLARNPTPKKSVLFAEIMGVLVGLLGIGIALLLSRYDIHSLFDVSIELAGLLGGGFAGAYTLGMFTRRANAQGVAIGIAGAIVLTLLIWSMDLVHPYFYLGISILLCIVIGYAASWLFPPPAQSLSGLTIHRQDAVGATR
ncbi:sodium:solute symporter [Pseudoxanthomonas sp. SE1]|uniref:sodium:solute symporter n=1 Tax=Pseudoxanthomonas sp. SE1 TaxID=1664560 RepID=UPI00240DCFBA|nr:sodium:solute symporter [Pseudoxanthomonas sp. SE1]WFC42483.1 sodium:solute symporter [Pseudoxanthomonas sp. SE1]